MTTALHGDVHSAGAVLQAGTPLESASLAVLLLHGRGASAEDILGLSAALDVKSVAYLAPQAAGHTWYPQSFLAPREANEPYLGSALAKIESIVNLLARQGFGTESIVIAGFSQGACLSSEFVATHPARYAGMIAFTGGLIGPPGSLAFAPSDKLAGTPALLLSGDPDPHVPWARVEETAAVLGAMGAEVTTKRYPGRPHTIGREEVELARELLIHASATV
jgi:phospholipase/carboxylesterase